MVETFFLFKRIQYTTSCQRFLKSIWKGYTEKIQIIQNEIQKCPESKILEKSLKNFQGQQALIRE